MMKRLDVCYQSAIVVFSLGLLTISLCLVGSGTTEAAVAYISNSLDDSVAVLVPDSEFRPMIPVGDKPLGVAVNPAGTRVYVTNYNSNTVSVIDPSLLNSDTRPVVTTIRVGRNPVGVAVSPDGALVYVANYTSNNVSVINAATNRVVATVGVGRGPSGVAVGPDGRAFVTNYLSNSVSVIRRTTLFGRVSYRVAATVGRLSGPYGIAVNTAGTSAYVANFITASVSIINTATNRIVRTVATGLGPTGIAVSPDGTSVYVTNFGDPLVPEPNGHTVSVIDTRAGGGVTTIDLSERNTQPYGIAIDSTGSLVFVANKGSDTVSIIEMSTNEVMIHTVFISGINCDSESCPSGPVAFGNFLLPDALDGTVTLSGSFSQASLGSDRPVPAELSTQQVSLPKASTLSGPSGRRLNIPPPHED